MTENIKKINNPLTIIAIFAALAEINATVAIKLLNPNLHYIFVWFIIGFPTLLVVLFFVTLNYNTKAMYSPSDYREDKSFIDSLYGLNKVESISVSMVDIENKIRNEVSVILTEQLDDKKDEKLSAGDIKNLLESAIEKKNNAVSTIPLGLSSEIIRWVTFPANIPLIYAIIKENVSSVAELANVKKTYNMLEAVERVGIKSLLRKKTILGTNDEFEINPIYKQYLFKWVEANESSLIEIVKVYEGWSHDTNNDIERKARVKAQNLLLEF
jgi:hypothetical protein